MKVLFATSECAPWVKTGGLGDVSAALPAALRDGGTDVRVLLPFYPALRAQFPHAPVLAHLRGLGGELPDATLRLAQADSGVPLLLLDNATCYQRPGSPYAAPDDRDWRDNDVRFGLLARAAAWLGGSDCTLDWQCDIVHCNDWQSALAPAYLHYLHSPGARRARTVMTVHNIAFQGMFDRVSLERVGLPDEAWRFDSVEFHGWLSFLKAGLQHADALTTVSPTYAREILTDEGGMGLAGLLRWRRNALVGILNGIDTKQWDPATDPLIEHHYDGAGLDAKRANKTALQRQLGLVPRDDRPLLGVVSRMTAQKGLDLLLPIADALAALPVQLVMLGTGDPALEHRLAEIARLHRGEFATVSGFDETLAHRIEAGTDIFLMPSRFEPCGLNQQYSLRYGTPPVVSAVGGLADTVIDCSDAALLDGTANGFVCRDLTPQALLATVQRAVAAWQQPDVWRRLQHNGMQAELGWHASAARYRALYQHLLSPSP